MATKPNSRQRVRAARPGGDRIAIYGLKNLGDPNAVRVHFDRLDGVHQFRTNAPSDWKVALCGRWGLLNKWICDPRWSWFGGRTKTLAAIWNKHIFTGDVTVDAHVALLMVRDDPPYAAVPWRLQHHDLRRRTESRLGLYADLRRRHQQLDAAVPAKACSSPWKRRRKISASSATASASRTSPICISAGSI